MIIQVGVNNYLYTKAELRLVNHLINSVHYRRESVFFSQEYIARRTGISLRHVQRLLNSEHIQILIQKTYRGMRKTCVYALTSLINSAEFAARYFHLFPSLRFPLWKLFPRSFSTKGKEVKKETEIVTDRNGGQYNIRNISENKRTDKKGLGGKKKGRDWQEEQEFWDKRRWLMEKKEEKQLARDKPDDFASPSSFRVNEILLA